MWAKMKGTIIKTMQQHIPYRKPVHGRNWLTASTRQIARKRGMANAKGWLNGARRLNANFQRKARKDKKKLEEACKECHTKELFPMVKQVKKTFSACQLSKTVMGM